MQNLKGNQHISAGIGIASSLKIGDYPDHEFEYIILREPDPMVQYKLLIINRTNFPTLLLSYSYSLHQKFTIGITGAYENSTGDFKQASEFVGNFRHQYLTVALEGKYLYLNHPGFSLYGSLGLGGVALFQKENFQQATAFINATNYNLSGFISPIGLRVGNKLGGFLEIGYGYKGILSAGINYRF